MVTALGGIVFGLGYLAIAFEHKLFLNKSALALLVGTVLWAIIALSQGAEGLMHLTEASGEIFSIVAFLLAAMALVEVLVHYKFFDVIRGKLFALKLPERKQFWVISAITFCLSAFLDNLTATIVMIQISRQFFKGENLLRTAAAVIVAANAGGAFSPIGDVTTIMLWIAKKFTAFEIISMGFLPSVLLWLVATTLIGRSLKGETSDTANEVLTKLTRSEKGVVGLVFVSFFLPVFANAIGLPPYMGLLFGLALVWLSVDILKQISRRHTHLEASIEELLRKADIASLQFFIGILFAVAALKELGALALLADFLYGAEPTLLGIVGGNIGLGFLSAILDNVPLTAIAIGILPTANAALWVLLALTAGTGGSLLLIGSVAGVVAMGMVKELTFVRYFQIAFLPALLAYLVGVAVWCVQFMAVGGFGA